MSFEFLEYKQFEVLNDAKLGAQFLPKEGFGKNEVCLVSPRHGRAVTMKLDDLTWINIKGIGWTFGGPSVYRSKKDTRMMFGLMDEKDAEREYTVSKYLQKINPSAPQILGYKSFKDVVFDNSMHTDVINICHTCGERVDPCVLYTQVKSPFRMADVAFFADKQRQEMLAFYSNYFKCTPKEFIKTFAYHIAEQIGLYHKEGIINDSLYWDNITLCAEIVDYEWLTVPGMVLPNGQDAEHYIPDERKEKEIIYALEAILRMSALFQIKSDYYDVLDALIEGHKIHNPTFMDSCEFLIRMKNRENIIY